MQIELPSRLPYPNTPAVDVVDDFHGTPVADPYRWMEESEAPGLADWIGAQNALTFSLIRAGGTRDRLHRRLTELWDYPKFSVLRREADRYFYWKNSGLQNQPELYMQSSVRAEPVSVLNPNVLSEDGTSAVTAESYTADGRLLGYALSRSGSDWQALRVRDLDSQTDLPDEIKWCKFTRPTWHPDQSGFFYSRYPEPGTVPPEEESYHQRVYWHALGTKQADDPLVYARPDARELGFQPRVTDDGNYLLLDVWKGTDPKNRVYYRRLEGNSGAGAIHPTHEPADSFDFVRLLETADARYEFVNNAGST
ncbi:MAG TPA: S9 family peptidase, partial [Chloroflexota bacterium]|nr:S9 family peptidase [Chloroflexota bacterium]